MPMDYRSLSSWILFGLFGIMITLSTQAQNCVIDNYALDTNRIDCDGNIQVTGQAFSELFSDVTSRLTALEDVWVGKQRRMVLSLTNPY